MSDEPHTANVEPMPTPEEVEEEVREWGKRHKLAPRTICNRAVGETHFFDIWRRGNKRTLERVKRLRDFMKKRDQDLEEANKAAEADRQVG